MICALNRELCAERERDPSARISLVATGYLVLPFSSEVSSIPGPREPARNGAVVTMPDVDHLVDASDALRGRESVSQARFLAEQLRAINDASPDMIAVFAADGRLLDVNERAVALLGYTRTEIRALPLHVLFGPGYSEARARTKLVAVLTVGALDFEWELRRRNGDMVAVEIRLRPVGRSGGSDDPAVIAIVRDVTQRKRFDEVLAMLARGTGRRTYDSFMCECVRRLALVCGARYAMVGRVDETNPHQVQTLAVWAGDKFVDNFRFALDGTPCADGSDPRARLITCQVCRIYPCDQMLHDMEIEGYFGMPLIAADGSMLGVVSVMSVRPMELEPWVHPLFDVVATRIANEIERAEATQKLVEARALLEQRVFDRTSELEHVNRELEAFTYSVSHDLRAPLRAVTGFSQVLDEDFGAAMDRTAHEHLSKVRRAAARMAELVEGLLRLSHLMSFELRADPVDLSALAEDTVRSLSEADPRRAVDVRIQPNLLALADPALMRIVIDNLIGNAWKYTSKRADARIEFTRVELHGGVAFCVSDNGVGFDMEHAAPRLFNAFQRLHGPHEFEGTGIGLATVQRIVRRHRGQVWAESQPGFGARFYFSLGGS